MIYYVYVICNNSGKFYIGQTSDLEKRLARHNSILPSKTSSFTKSKGPWKVTHQEECKSRLEAKIREKQLKSFKGREFIKNKIASTAQR